MDNIQNYVSYINMSSPQTYRSYLMRSLIIIQFNSLLFMCRVNSYKANYRYSVDTIIIVIIILVIVIIQ
jgi:hypothetical protein